MYSVFRFEVTPATVVAFLTILGFSLYDTIVVFDKVNENTDRFAGARVPYADVINVSMNQVLMRSLNTSIAAVLPVLSLLVLGSGIMGAVDAARLLAGAARRPDHRLVLVDLHRRAAAGDVQGARAPVSRSCAAPHATGVELERLVLGGSPVGDGARRPATAASPATAKCSSGHHAQHAGVGAHPSAAATEEEASHQLSAR